MNILRVVLEITGACAFTSIFPSVLGSVHAKFQVL
jgi:hypothetical protein